MPISVAVNTLSSGGTCFANLIPSQLTFFGCFSSRFKQEFGFHRLPFSLVQSGSFSTCHSLCLSWLLSYFRFSAFDFSLHCLLPHLICCFWAFLTLLGLFQLVYCLELVRLSFQDSLVSHYKSLLPGRLEEQLSPVFDILVHWSSPVDSTSDSGLAQELHLGYSWWQTAV